MKKLLTDETETCECLANDRSVRRNGGGHYGF